MREFKINGKNIIVYTSGELRKVIDVKLDTWKRYCQKGYIPESPIYMDYETNLPERDADGNILKTRLTARRRFYTERMILVFKAWFDAVRRGKKKKRVEPTEEDIELLRIEFSKAVLEFKESLTRKDMETDRVVKDLFIKLFGSIDSSVFKSKNDYKEFLYTEFLKATSEYFK
jgi:hypothetical protein